MNLVELDLELRAPRVHIFTAWLGLKSIFEWGSRGGTVCRGEASETTAIGSASIRVYSLIGIYTAKVSLRKCLSVASRGRRGARAATLTDVGAERRTDVSRGRCGWPCWTWDPRGMRGESFTLRAFRVAGVGNCGTWRVAGHPFGETVGDTLDGAKSQQAPRIC